MHGPAVEDKKSQAGQQTQQTVLMISLIFGFKTAHVGQSVIAALLDVCHTLAVSVNKADAFAYY